MQTTKSVCWEKSVRHRQVPRFIGRTLQRPQVSLTFSEHGIVPIGRMLVVVINRLLQRT